MTDDLATYLNDHLAGATAGVELADRLVKLFGGTDSEETLRTVRDNIEADREALKSLIDNLGIEQMTIRNVGAWLAEKAAELKLKFDDPDSGAFARFEALEALSLGIEGKRSLWLALRVLLDDGHSADVDLDTLIARAESQREIVESLRIQAASDAFGN